MSYFLHHNFLSFEDNESALPLNEEIHKNELQVQDELEKSDRDLESQTYLLKQSNNEIDSLNKVADIVSKTNSSEILSQSNQMVLVNSIERFREHFNIVDKDLNKIKSFENFNNYPTLKNSLESIQELASLAGDKILTLLQNIGIGVKDFFHKLFNSYSFYTKKYEELKLKLNEKDLSLNKGRKIKDKTIYSNLNINNRFNIDEIFKSLKVEDNFNYDMFEDVSKTTLDFLNNIKNDFNSNTVFNKTYLEDKFPQHLKKANFSIVNNSTIFNKETAVWGSNFLLPGNKRILITVKDKALKNDSEDKTSLAQHSFPYSFKIEQESISSLDFTVPAIDGDSLPNIKKTIQFILDSKNAAKKQSDTIDKLNDAIQSKIKEMSKIANKNIAQANNFNKYNKDDLKNTMKNISEVSDTLHEFLIDFTRANFKFKVKLLEYFTNYLEKSINLID